VLYYYTNNRAKVFKHFLPVREGYSPCAWPLKAAGLASSRTPLSLNGTNALLQPILEQNRLQVLLAVFGTKTRLLCKLAKSFIHRYPDTPKYPKVTLYVS